MVIKSAVAAKNFLNTTLSSNELKEAQDESVELFREIKKSVVIENTSLYYSPSGGFIERTKLKTIFPSSLFSAQIMLL